MHEAAVHVALAVDLHPLGVRGGDLARHLARQTADLAPADRRLYAIRDVTATVESIPLITASILSNKIAAGLDALVMDVKVGTGAFMPSEEKSLELARSIIATAAQAKLPTHAVLTDMNEVLGTTAGNALEIEESMAYLRGEARDPRLDAVVMARFEDGAPAMVDTVRSTMMYSDDTGSGSLPPPPPLHAVSMETSNAAISRFARSD